MMNWLEQKLSVDDIVYRGARDGDHSSYRIGRITAINEVTKKITVKWIFEYGWISHDEPWGARVLHSGRYGKEGYRRVPMVGTSDGNTFVKLEMTEFIQDAVNHFEALVDSYE